MNASEIVPGLLHHLNMAYLALTTDSTTEVVIAAGTLLRIVADELSPAALEFHAMGHRDSLAIAEHRAAEAAKTS